MQTVVATHIFLEFSSLLVEDSHFDSYFSNGLVAPPASIYYFGSPFQKLQGKWIPGFPTNFETSELLLIFFLMTDN